MNVSRRKILSIALVGAASPALVSAQAGFPDRPIRLVVPYPPGGQSDITARLLSEKLHAALGQPVVVENRGGANGSIGAAYLAKAPADGYTLGLVAASHVLNGALIPQLSFDPVKSFAGVAVVTKSPIAMVVPSSLPVKSVSEFVAYARANKGRVSYGSAGVGSNIHVFAAWFNDLAGLDMVHVPNRGSGPAHIDLMAGRTQLMFDTHGAVRPHIASGRMRLIATGAGRLANHPDVPSVAEAGYPTFTASSWGAIIAPSGVPKDVLDKLNKAVNSVLADPAIRARIEESGAEVGKSAPPEVDALLAADERRFSQLIKAQGITLN